MNNPTPGTTPESDRTRPRTPRIRVLHALRELDVELARLARTARSDAELRAALADLLASANATAARPDGTTTLVVGTAAWARLRTAADPGLSAPG